MPSRRVPGPRLAPRLLAAALASVLAACPAGQVGPPKPTKAPVKPAASVKATGKASPSPEASRTPEALPSLGLLLAGQVAVDPTRLLAAGLAERSAGLIGKVKLISDAGSGIISDQGAGLISDAGSGLIGNNAGNLISDAGSGLIGKVKLISDAGSGLVSDAGSGLVGNNGGGLIGKTKYGLYELQDGGMPRRTGMSESGQASGAAPVPVQGMVVFAVSLKDGKVVAGPIRTDADGRWRLGFVQAPDDNIRIMAQVYGHATEPDFNYAALVAPKDAQVDLTDTTRAVAIFLIQIMRARVQDAIDARKRGEEFKVWYVGPSNPDAQSFLSALDGSIGIMTPEVATKVDRDGRGALMFAEKVLGFADLTKPMYKDLHAVTEEIRAYGQTLGPGEGAKLMDDYVALTANRSPVQKLPALLEKYGMPSAQATDLARRYGIAGDAIFLDMAAVAKENMGAVLEPFLTFDE